MLTQLQVGELLKTLKDPHYAEPGENSSVVLYGEFNGYTIPFIASPKDMMDYGRNIYQRAIDGDYGPIKSYNKNNPMSKPETLDLFAEKKE